MRRERRGRERRGLAASGWCRSCGLLQRPGRCPGLGLGRRTQENQDQNMKEPFLTCPTLQHTAEHGIVLLSIKQNVVGHIGYCHGIEDEPGISIKLYLKKERLNGIYDHIK